MTNTNFIFDLFKALSLGRNSTVKYLLANIETNLNDIKDNKGNTALHIALENNSALTKEIVELLLAKGCSIFAKNDNGDTPLKFVFYHTTHDKKYYYDNVILVILKKIYSDCFSDNLTNFEALRAEDLTDLS